MRLIIEEKLGLPSFFYREEGRRRIVLEEMSKAVKIALEQIRGILYNELPIGATEKLRESLTTDIKAVGREITGRLFNKGYAKRYAGVVELGRRAGARMPPQSPIVKWLMVKKGLSKEEASRAAFMVRYTISKRGLPARLHWSRNAMRFKSITHNELHKGLEKVLKRIVSSPRTRKKFNV